MGSSPIRDQTRLLRRQVDPLPLHHQGGPGTVLQLKALCGGGTISQGPSAVLRPLLGQPSPWVALSALGVGWGSQQVPLTGNQTLPIDGNKRPTRMVGGCARVGACGKPPDEDETILRGSLKNNKKKTDAPHPYQRSHCQDVPQVVRSLPRPPGPSAFWTPGQAPCTRSVQKARPWQVGKGGGRSHLCPGISCVRRCSRYSHPTPSEGAGDSAAPSPVASPAGAPSLAQLAAMGQPSGSPRAPTTQCPARDAGSTSLPPCSASSLPH